MSGSRTLGRSEIYIRNNNGPRTVLWGTPESTESSRDLTPSTITLCDTGTRWSMYGCPRWCRRARASTIACDAAQYQRPCWSRALWHQPGYPVDQAYSTCHGLSVKAVIHMNIPLKSHDYKVLRYHVCLGVTWYGKTLHVPLICKRSKSQRNWSMILR